MNLISKIIVTLVILLITLAPTYFALFLLWWTEPVGFFQKAAFWGLIWYTMGDAQIWLSKIMVDVIDEKIINDE